MTSQDLRKSNVNRKATAQSISAATPVPYSAPDPAATSRTALPAFELSRGDGVLKHLPFEYFRTTTSVNLTRPLIPEGKSFVEITTSSGSKIQANDADLIAERYEPNGSKRWVIKRDIAASTYEEVSPGQFSKTGLVKLAPGTSLTNNPDASILFHTDEGPVEKRSGDCFIAVGAKGEVYPVSVETVSKTMQMVSQDALAQHNQSKEICGPFNLPSKRIALFERLLTAGQKVQTSGLGEPAVSVRIEIAPDPALWGITKWFFGDGSGERLLSKVGTGGNTRYYIETGDIFLEFRPDGTPEALFDRQRDTSLPEFHYHHIIKPNREGSAAKLEERARLAVATIIQRGTLQRNPLLWDSPAKVTELLAS